MKEVSTKILEIIENYETILKNIKENFSSIKLSNDKWSLKEIIGHLIDSASNNHQRIVRLNTTKKLSFPDYNKDIWISSEHHNKHLFLDLLNLFLYFNKFLSVEISNIKDDSKDNIWIEINKTQKQIVEHYLEHLLIHYDHLIERITELNNFK